MEIEMRFRKIAGFIITTFICIIIIFANGQAKISALTDSISIKFTTASPAVEIPFENYMNYIFLNVKINGVNRCFLLDSGFRYSELNADRIEELGLIAGKSHQEKTGRGDIVVSSVNDINIELPGLVITNKTMEAIPLNALESGAGRQVYGVLGFDIISRITIEIDYDQEMLSLIQPDSFNYAGSGEIVPVELINNRAYIWGEVLMPGQYSILARFGVDTGSDCAIYFESSFIHGKELVTPDQSRIQVGAVTVGGTTKINVTRLKGFKIGQTTFDNMIVGYSADTLRGDPVGLIGSEILKRFKVIFDIAGKRLILEKGQHFNDPFDIDMSGIVPIVDSTDNKSIIISSVSKNSPAYHEGLKAGDRIFIINQEPVSEINISKFREMMKKDGARYILSIKRGEEIFVAVIKLKRII